MRCRNCGWENPQGVSACEKCHAPIKGSLQYNSDSALNHDLRSTMLEASVQNNLQESDVPISCTKCGYPMSSDAMSCPNCGMSVSVRLSQASNPTLFSERVFSMGTVIGGPLFAGVSTNLFCTLKPIAWQGEEVQYNPITYSGERIVLNRNNTDSNNNSITSREQAVLTYVDGDWYIENRSDLRTTYIRVNGRIKLNSGDIIVLGNREFEFKG